MSSASKEKSHFARWVLGIVALLVIAMLVFVVNANSKIKEKGEQAKSEAAATLKLNIPENASAIGSFAVDKDGGIIAPGEADLSKTRVEFIFDPHCGGCKIVETGLKDKLAELRSNGDIQLYFTPVSFMGHSSPDEYSSRATSALVTVAEHDPANFTVFMNKIYEKFPNPYPSSGVSYEKIGEWAKEAGVSQEAIDRFSDQDYRKFATENVPVQEKRTEIFTTGEISTPTVLVGGEINDAGVLQDFIRVPFQDSDVVKTFTDTLKEVTDKSSNVG